MNFSIVVTTGNAGPWIGRCIQSIAEQRTHWTWNCLVIDDASHDETQTNIQSTLSAIRTQEIRQRFTVLRNTHRQGALANLVSGFNSLGTSDRPMDVLIPIDGDDWLFSNSALETIAQTYERTGCWLTYGGLITSPGGDLYCTRVTDGVIAAGKHRQSTWLTSHLRSFRSHLWHAIRDEDLRDERGAYYAVTWDMAFMFPMLEMAGERIQSVERAVYVYNVDNPASDHVQKRAQQLEAERRIRSNPPYRRLTQPVLKNKLNEPQSTLGFVIVSDENPGQTIRLIQSLDTFCGSPPIHCLHNPFANPLGKQPNTIGLSLAQDETDFERGSFSLVESILTSLNYALEHWRETEWIALIDHESHPLIEMNELLGVLAAQESDGFLHAEPIIPGRLETDWQAVCWQRYGDTDGRHPFHEHFCCYAGSPWMLLRRNAVETLLNFHREQPWLANHYRWQGERLRSTVPEESYLHTILCNQQHLKLNPTPICWTDWSTGKPRILNEGDWRQLQESKSWFAQRFRDPQSSRLIDKIHDSWMLNRMGSA
jgi:hypothetical protein